MVERNLHGHPPRVRPEPHPPTAITALSCTSQWSGTVPVAADGRPLGNAITWMDHREARSTGPASTGSAPLYGIAATFPVRNAVGDLLERYVDRLYQP